MADILNIPVRNINELQVVPNITDMLGALLETKIPVGNLPDSLVGEAVTFGQLKEIIALELKAVSPETLQAALAAAELEMQNQLQSQQESLNVIKEEIQLETQAQKDHLVAVEADLQNQMQIQQNYIQAVEVDMQAQVNANGIGNRAYKTYAAMDADKANIAAKSKVTVTNDTTESNNGDWQWDGTVFVKSAYDPLTQSKNYADTNPLFKPVNLVANSDLNNLTAEGYFIIRANASTMLNMPELANGVGFEGVDSTGAKVQWYIAQPTNNFWFRTKWGGAWKPWRKTVDETQILPVTTQRVGAQTLASYETQGIYNFSSSATFSDLPTDAPIGVGYTLKVEDYLSGGRFKLQKLRCDSSKAGLKWERSLDAQNHTVGAWVFDSRLHDGQVLPENLSASFRYKGAFTGVSIADYRSDGIYTFITASDQPSGSSSTSGLVDVKNWFSGSFVIQTWYTANKVDEQFVRLVRPAAIGGWVRVGAGSSSSVFADKKIVCFGDSITEFGTYPTQVANRLGATGYNIGFGGTRWGKHDNALYNEMSMYRVADYIANDNLTGLMNAAIALRDSTFADDNTAAVSRLQSADLSTVDYVSIFYGTNDFQGLVPIGTDSDATGDTFKGAINLSLDKLLTKHPNLKILLVTPIWRARQVSGDGLESDANPNSLGLYLRDYVEAIKDMGKKYHIPVLDLYNNSGISKYTKTLYLSSDELHPNNAGYTHLANLIAAKLSSTY